MSIGERIRFLRNLRGYTQKYLGMLVGFPEKTADVRMAQYESGRREPKESLIQLLAPALQVCPYALRTPDIESDLGLMYALFIMEDLHGLTLELRNGEALFYFDVKKGSNARRASSLVYQWASILEKYRSGEITKEEYDQWRYNYPETSGPPYWVRIPKI